ncbi:MAG: hypothetical protein AAF598_07930 [Bacteroidota bacterium]
MNDETQFYYTTSKSHEDDIQTAMDLLFNISNKDKAQDPDKNQAWDDARHYLVEYAVLNDLQYLRLMIGLMKRIDTTNCHLESDEAVMFSKLLYTDDDHLISEKAFSIIVEGISSNPHPTLQSIAKTLE